MWAVTNQGYWFCPSEVISPHLFYCCLRNCPHYPPQPQLVCLMLRRRREHMHQRAGARISVQSKSAEIWNALPFVCVGVSSSIYCSRIAMVHFYANHSCRVSALCPKRLGKHADKKSLGWTLAACCWDTSSHVQAPSPLLVRMSVHELERFSHAKTNKWRTGVSPPSFKRGRLKTPN